MYQLKNAKTYFNTRLKRMEILMAPETGVSIGQPDSLKLEKLPLAAASTAKGLSLVELQVVEVKGAPLYVSCVACKKKRQDVCAFVQ